MVCGFPLSFSFSGGCSGGCSGGEWIGGPAMGGQVRRGPKTAFLAGLERFLYCGR